MPCFAPLGFPPDRRWRSPPASANALGMKRTPRAGGFFLMAAILLGFAIGLATGDAMRGVIIGTALGIAIAVGLWLSDRRRAD